MINKWVLTAGIFVSCGSHALAEPEETGPQVYVGIGVASMDLDSENTVGSNDDIQSSGFTGYLGVEFNTILALEIDAALGGGDGDTISRGSDDVDVGLNSMFGAYARASLPVSRSVSLFGRAGFANVDYTVRDPSVGSGFEASTDRSDSGLALGIGLQISFDDELKHSLRADFTQIDTDTLPTQRYGLSYVRRF